MKKLEDRNVLVANRKKNNIFTTRKEDKTFNLGLLIWSPAVIVKVNITRSASPKEYKLSIVPPVNKALEVISI